MRLVVNSECELVLEKGDDYDLLGGSVSVRVVAEKCLSPSQYKIWRKRERKQEYEVLDRYVQQHVDLQFDIDVFSESPIYYDFYSRVCQLQKINDSRVRIWAEKIGEPINYNSPENIWLATEFRAFTDTDECKELWKEVERAAVSPYSIYVMDEDKETDRYKYNDDDDWTNGPNHGRPYKQVEFRRNISPILPEISFPSLAAVARCFARELEEITEPFWNASGVGVC